MPGIIIGVVEDENWRENLFGLEVRGVCYTDTQLPTILRKGDFVYFCTSPVIVHTEVSLLLRADNED